MHANPRAKINLTLSVGSRSPDGYHSIDSLILRVGLSDAMTKSRANLYRYPPGAVGRRHIDPIQEEVFVVLDGMLTIHMGEGDQPEKHELSKGSVLVVQPDDVREVDISVDDALKFHISLGVVPPRESARSSRAALTAAPAASTTPVEPISHLD